MGWCDGDWICNSLVSSCVLPILVMIFQNDKWVFNVYPTGTMNRAAYQAAALHHFSQVDFPQANCFQRGTPVSLFLVYCFYYSAFQPGKCLCVRLKVLNKINVLLWYIHGLSYSKCTLCSLACSQPGEWHLYHRPACDRVWRSGEPVLGPLQTQREPAHHLRWRHVSPLGDHSLSAGLRHYGLCWQVW